MTTVLEPALDSQDMHPSLRNARMEVMRLIGSGDLRNKEVLLALHELMCVAYRLKRRSLTDTWLMPHWFNRREGTWAYAAGQLRTLTVKFDSTRQGEWAIAAVAAAWSGLEDTTPVAA